MSPHGPVSIGSGNLLSIVRQISGPGWRGKVSASISSDTRYSDYSATVVHYLCVFMPLSAGSSLSLMCTMILVCDVHMKARRALTWKLGKVVLYSVNPGAEP